MLDWLKRRSTLASIYGRLSGKELKAVVAKGHREVKDVAFLPAVLSRILLSHFKPRESWRPAYGPYSFPSVCFSSTCLLASIVS